MTIFGGYNAGLEPGAIMPVAAGSPVPDGFLLCDGSAISRRLYPELFEAIGTNYGAGDGSTTFNIPNGVLRLLGQTARVLFGQLNHVWMVGTNGAQLNNVLVHADRNEVYAQNHGIAVYGIDSGYITDLAAPTINLLIKYRW